MDHYVIQDAGDMDVVGDYFANGEERNGCPIYENHNGIILSREQHPVDNHTNEVEYGWILGNKDDCRPLYGVMSEDLSVPTLGWREFTAPEPMPVIRYFEHP